MRRIDATIETSRRKGRKGMKEYFLLENERLKIKVANAPYGYYDSSRFDWTGFVVSILLDDKFEFAGCEAKGGISEDPKSLGRGLCTEFRVPHHAPMAKPGEKFLKPGVGLLTQKDDGSLDWKFNYRYEIDPFRISAMSGKDWISYQVEGKEWKGIRLNEYKTLRLIGNSIVETITLDNLGTETFRCMDFNHDFFQINRLPLGPSYRLEVPAYTEDELRSSIVSGDITVKDGCFTWEGTIKEESRTSLVTDPILTDNYVWALYNDDVRAGIREYIDIPYEEFAIWAVDHVVTPKILAPIGIPGGSSGTWTRKWECFTY